MAGPGLASIGYLQVPAGACRCLRALYHETMANCYLKVAPRGVRDDKKSGLGTEFVNLPGLELADIAHSPCNVPSVAAGRLNAESSAEFPGDATGKSWSRSEDHRGPGPPVLVGSGSLSRRRVLLILVAVVAVEQAAIS